MTREEALELLRGGEEGVKKWNQTRPETIDLSEANLRKAVLRKANLRGTNLYGAKLDEADLYGADLSESDLSGGDLSEANLYRADLNRADLEGANLSKANLCGAELLRANLSEAILCWAALNEGNLRAAVLRAADLSDAIVIDSNLRQAIVCNADVRRAKFSGADLSGADLSGADLSGADLSGANLLAALFEGTFFNGTKLESTVMSSDLSTAQSLESSIHLGPSHVSTQCLAMSKGRIPDSFLRGCGLSPWEVQSAKLFDDTLSPHEVSEIVTTRVFPARSGDAIRLGGVFISYSHANSNFADKLRTELYDAGASVWLDRHDLVAGDMQKQIGRALRLNDVVVLVLSEDSIKSDWVEHELETARQKEKDEGRDVLCPVALDDSWKSKLGDVLWRQLAKKNILDFSAWKTNFHGQFGKLVKGLQINYP